MSGTSIDTVRLPEERRPPSASSAHLANAAADPVLLRFPSRVSTENDPLAPPVRSPAVETSAGEPVWIRGYRGKRTFDLLTAGAITFLFAPVTALVAAGLALTGSGTLFEEERVVGPEGRVVGRRRFRTRVPLRSEREGISSSDLLPLFNRSSRPRTRFGRFLHATGLERLPELGAVLRGDLALVGPPPRSEQDAKAKRAPSSRWELKPGLIWPTGDGEDRAATMDYVARQGVWMDLRILAAAAWRHLARPFRKPV